MTDASIHSASRLCMLLGLAALMAASCNASSVKGAGADASSQQLDALSSERTDTGPASDAAPDTDEVSADVADEGTADPDAADVAEDTAPRDVAPTDASLDGANQTSGFERCDNGEDDDHDGLVDCLDSECEDNTWCDDGAAWLYYHVSGVEAGLRAFRTDDPDTTYAVVSPAAPGLNLSIQGISPRGDFLVVGTRYLGANVTFVLDLRTGGLRRWAGGDGVVIAGWRNNFELVGMWLDDELGPVWVGFGTFDTRVDNSPAVIRFVPDSGAVFQGALSANGDHYVYGDWRQNGNPFTGGGGAVDGRLVEVDLVANSLREIPIDVPPFAIEPVPGLGGYLFALPGAGLELRDSAFGFIRRVPIAPMEVVPLDAERVASIGREIRVQTWTGAPVLMHVPVSADGTPLGSREFYGLWASPVTAAAFEPFFAVGGYD